MKKAKHPEFVQESNYDLAAGIYAITSDAPMSIAAVAGDTVKVLADSGVRRLRLVVPEGGTFLVTHTAPVFVRSVTLSDPVDGTPHEALLSEPQPLTLQEQIARFLGQAIAARDDAAETFEEADDFDIDDDDIDLPLSRYQLPVAKDEPSLQAPVSPPPATSDDPKETDSPPPRS